MTPDPSTGFAARVAEVCAGFVATGPPQRVRKSELLPGEHRGTPVIAKRLLRPDPVWDWYFAREVAIYRAFAATQPPVRVPGVHATSDDVLVIERFDAPLARLRRPAAELPSSTIEAAIGYHDRLAAWSCPVTSPPPPRVHEALRQRLLEDPTDAGWIRAGLERCRRRTLIDDQTLVAAHRALAAHAPVATCHGDLLLRNAMTTASGDLVLVDWECAGPHVADWDLALLWTQLAGSGREVVDAAIGAGPRRLAFVALVVFALCRELVFYEAFRVPADHRGRLAVQTELDAQATVLVDADAGTV